MIEPAPTRSLSISEGELESLAGQLGNAYDRAVRFYQRELGLPPAEAEARAAEPATDDDLDRVCDAPPRQVNWLALSGLARQDPALAVLAWEDLKRAARAELESGQRAASALEYEASPFDRARFGALRESFREEWQPRGGIEATLIDTLAQAQTSYLFWLERLHVRASTDAWSESHSLEERGAWVLPRVTAAEATEQAAAMVDRFHKLFIRNLRALRDLRRYAPTIHIEHAGQVNLAQGDQVNVAQGQRGTD